MVLVLAWCGVAWRGSLNGIERKFTQLMTAQFSVASADAAVDGSGSADLVNWLAWINGPGWHSSPG
jgi:hypothetical protein